MAEKKVPWWRKALNYALEGIRSGFGLFQRAAKSAPIEQPGTRASSEEILEEEIVLTEDLSSPETIAAEPVIPTEPARLPEPVEQPAIEVNPDLTEPIEPIAVMEASPLADSPVLPITPVEVASEASVLAVSTSSDNPSLDLNAAWLDDSGSEAAVQPLREVAADFIPEELSGGASIKRQTIATDPALEARLETGPGRFLEPKPVDTIAELSAEVAIAHHRRVQKRNLVATPATEPVTTTEATASLASSALSDSEPLSTVTPEAVAEENRAVTEPPAEEDAAPGPVDDIESRSNIEQLTEPATVAESSIAVEPTAAVAPVPVSEPVVAESVDIKYVTDLPCAETEAIGISESISSVEKPVDPADAEDASPEPEPVADVSVAEDEAIGEAPVETDLEPSVIPADGPDSAIEPTDESAHAADAAPEAAEKGETQSDLPEKHTAGPEGAIDSASVMLGLESRHNAPMSFSAACETRRDSEPLTHELKPVLSTEEILSLVCWAPEPASDAAIVEDDAVAEPTAEADETANVVHLDESVLDGQPIVEPASATEPAAKAEPGSAQETDLVIETAVETFEPVVVAEPNIASARDLPANSVVEPCAVTVAEPAAPAAESVPGLVAAVKPPIKLVTRDDSADLSPFSVIVDQVYDGPLDLLLDLIRKQDIDIYDIPIAKITAQFLAYVNQLRSSDVDVAGEFIYIASLLIHIKSKMLLPRAPTGPDDAPEDPRRELVERLLEHERFKNAAQMLQQKQMLEAATWTNPGFREFQDDAAAEPEIAADTVDLVRVFRDILERARKRPVFNVDEDSVTVGQMIQFLSRRLTMEDKPVALRRLLSHTRSERALVAMFLALLELVRLQAVLLRQDRAFSEIFIKKHTGFDAVLNEGLTNTLDDWR